MFLYLFVRVLLLHGLQYLYVVSSPDYLLAGDEIYEISQTVYQVKRAVICCTLPTHLVSAQEEAEAKPLARLFVNEQQLVRAIKFVFCLEKSSRLSVVLYK